MHTVRMTLNVNEELLAEVVEAHPGVTTTALVEEGLRALLAKRAASRLAALGGTARAARLPSARPGNRVDPRRHERRTARVLHTRGCPKFSRSPAHATCTRAR